MAAWRMGWIILMLAAVVAGAARRLETARRVPHDAAAPGSSPASGKQSAGHVTPGDSVAQTANVAQDFSPARSPRSPEHVPQQSADDVAPSPATRPRSLADLWLGSRPALRTVEGNLVDLNCYVEHAGVGPGHVHCARACAQKGMPLALLDSSGKLFVVSGPGHVDPRTLNAPLLDHLERTVRVTGLFFDHEDVKLVAIDRVEPAQQAPLEDILRRYRGPRE